RPGSLSAYLFALDVDQPVREKSSVGASVYYLTDHGDYSYPTLTPYSSSWDLWAGVRGKTVGGEVPLNGFVVVNTGQLNLFSGDSPTHTGWAALGEIGPVPVGCGKVSTQAILSSGGSNEFRTVAQTSRDNFGSQGYWSYL